MADFLDSLGSVLEQQFTLGENKLKNLDVVKNGRTVPYGRLGKFADQFDQSAERSYTEEGMFRTDLFNPRAKQLEIWMQEPDVTILVKKRAFSSLVENYRTDLLSKDERLFIRASKFLFQNKCKQIAAYERLTKIESVVTEIGHVDYHLLPAIFAATDALDSAFNALGSSAFSKFKGIIDRVRTVVNLSHDNIYTTWTTNVLNSFRTDMGEGTGVIEFTTGFNLDTTTSTHFGAGRFNISFIDPHEIMRVTHIDIEQAIADATNVVYGHSIFTLGLDTLNNTIQENKNKLNKVRAKRGANPINFITNPDTFLGKRVRAIIDNSGIEIQFEGSLLKVDVDPEYLYPSGSLAEKDGLSKEEEKIFKTIVKSLFNSMQLDKNSRTIAKAHNAETNEVRKKLRLHYGSKLIIQPMDVVNIFISSKTRVDNKALGGLQDSFNALGFLQTANKALTTLQDLMNVDTDSIDKSIFVGKDFPNWLWRVLRNQFTVDKSGTQVFCGLVEQSSSSYDNGGSFTVNVSGGDNSSYFNFGVVNFKPALDVWNGSLYDPITPFDIKFDRATGFQKDTVPQLLKENQELFNSTFIKYKNGVYVGKKPTLNNFVQDTERVQNDSVRRVFYDPDGMVYKWKEGIGTLVMFGNNYEENSPTNRSVPPITVDPFAGQDIMNVLSLLVTGEPYNFATFYKAASQFDNFGRDPITQQDPSVSYFKNLQTDIKKRNLLYGNFVPFKSLSMDTETYKKVLTSQIKTEGFDRELSDLLEQQADLNDRISFLTNNNNASNLSIDANNLKPKLQEIEKSIAAKMQQINDELNKIDKPISIVGNDISLDYSSFIDLKDKNSLNDYYNINRDIRRRINYLTRRPSWKVRANEDVNFFIVDDTYDKDYDIQAFEKAFENPALFRSDYETVSEKIAKIKDLLDLEVFADSQGHIQVRAPRYNKIPSSVFYRMLRLKQEFDIQLYPQFLEDMYVSQIENIMSRIEVIEDEIRMYGLSLSKNSDSELEAFIASTQTSLPGNRTISSSNFKFISDEGTGFTSRIVLKDLSTVDNPDEAVKLFESGLNSLSSVKTQSTINNIFSVTSRVDVFKKVTSISKKVSDILSDSQVKTRADKIQARLQNKTGQNFDLAQLFPNSQKLLGGAKISNLDLFKVTQEISARIAERQRILKIAANALKNAQEGISLISNKNRTANKMLASNLLDNKNVPQVFESMIQDESYDDYGPGSGRRYIIKNNHIKSISISEKAPQFTAIEVQGRFGDNFQYNLPQDLQGFQGGGNGLTTAVAVDYDLWRMYGIRIPQSVSAPYLTDPNTQCAPFAVALLNKSRKQIHSGTINIVGNEYMQPGEVVYVENQDMLYYVESVQHRVAYGRDFSTTLNVGYGHMPGEYIPTYLDTIGKILYKNREVTSMVSVRHGNVNNEEHIGTIVSSLSGDVIGSQGLAINSIMQGTFANENRQTLNAILQAAESVFSTGATNGYQPVLELRIFYASTSGGFGKPSSSATEIAKAVQDYLLGNNNMYELTNVKAPQSWLRNFANYIKIVRVDADFTEEFRSPSSHAYSMARSALSKKSVKAASDSKKIDNVIYNNVIDCWIRFEQV